MSVEAADRTLFVLDANRATPIHQQIVDRLQAEEAVARLDAAIGRFV